MRWARIKILKLTIYIPVHGNSKRASKIQHSGGAGTELTNRILSTFDSYSQDCGRLKNTSNVDFVDVTSIRLQKNAEKKIRTAGSLASAEVYCVTQV